jgi:hypothetical protein
MRAPRWRFIELRAECKLLLLIFLVIQLVSVDRSRTSDKSLALIFNPVSSGSALSYIAWQSEFDRPIFFSSNSEMVTPAVGVN